MARWLGGLIDDIISPQAKVVPSKVPSLCRDSLFIIRGLGKIARQLYTCTVYELRKFK